MSARHIFTEPYQPYDLDELIPAIDEAETQDSLEREADRGHAWYDEGLQSERSVWGMSHV